MKNLPALLTLVSTGLLACSRSSPAPSGSASSTAANTDVAASAPPAATVSSSTARGSPCPRTGLWALCSVEKRLEQSGFVVRRASGVPTRRAGFSVLPAVYNLGRSRLEVFIYPTQDALSADVAKIDTVFAAPRGAPNPWETAPTFVRSANMAAVFLTDNGTQAERLALALTAGAPQP